MALAALKLEKLPVVGETMESTPAGKPCNAGTSLLGDCCPFPGELLAGLQPMEFLTVDVQSTTL